MGAADDDDEPARERDLAALRALPRAVGLGVGLFISGSLGGWLALAWLWVKPLAPWGISGALVFWAVWVRVLLLTGAGRGALRLFGQGSLRFQRRATVLWAVVATGVTAVWVGLSGG